MTKSAMSLSPEIVVVNADSVTSTKAYEGLTRRVLAYNDKLMLVEHTMEAGSEFPRHSHPHEQLAYLVSGHIQVYAGSTSFEARAGDSFVLKGNVEHNVIALERSVALDIFTPVRDDYID